MSEVRIQIFFSKEKWEPIFTEEQVDTAGNGDTAKNVSGYQQSGKVDTSCHCFKTRILRY